MCFGHNTGFNPIALRTTGEMSINRGVRSNGPSDDSVFVLIKLATRRRSRCALKPWHSNELRIVHSNHMLWFFSTTQPQRDSINDRTICPESTIDAFRFGMLWTVRARDTHETTEKSHFIHLVMETKNKINWVKAMCTLEFNLSVCAWIVFICI